MKGKLTYWQATAPMETEIKIGGIVRIIEQILHRKQVRPLAKRQTHRAAAVLHHDALLSDSRHKSAKSRQCCTTAAPAFQLFQHQHIIRAVND